MKKSTPTPPKLQSSDSSRPKACLLSLLVLVLSSLSAYSQNFVASTKTNIQPTEKKKASNDELPAIKKEAETVYVSKTERVYVNKNLPIYLKFSTAPDGEVYSLKSEKHPEDAEPFFLDTEGANYIRSKWAIDAETKEYAMPLREIEMELYADSYAPLVSPKISSSQKFKSGNETYYGEDIQIHLDTWDAQAGVKASFWSINNETWKSGTTSFETRPSGKYTFNYYAADNVNNYSEPAEISFIYDKTAPETSLQKTELGTYIFGPQTELNFQVEEQHSGVHKTYFQLDEMESHTASQAQLIPTETEDGTYKLTYHSVDNVSNAENEKTQEIYYDKTPPSTILFANPSFEENSTLFVSGISMISLESSDNKAGVKATTFTTRGYNKENFADPITLTEYHGNTSISFFSEDMVNNREATQTHKIFVDTLRPSSTLNFMGDYFEVAGRYYLNADTKIALTATDQDAGVAKIEYGGIGNDFKNYVGEIKLQEEGHFGMMYRAIDNVGNAEYSNSVDLYLDVKGPEIVHNFSNQPLTTEGEMAIYPVGTRLFLGATDDQAGTSSISYQINNQKEVSYSSPKTIDISEKKAFKKGKVYEIRILSTDLVNNTTEQTLAFKIED